MKPILFNSDMVRAILAGRKTVTRRIVRPKYRRGESGWRIVRNKYTGEFMYCEYYDEHEASARSLTPPYRIGEILYVRETWKQATGDPAGGGYALFDTYVYKADGKAKDDYPLDCLDIEKRWHPSIHMPKEAARIFLRVTEVMVERLQDMTEDDACWEGYNGCPFEHTIYFPEGGMEICVNIPGECPVDLWYCNHSLQEGFGRDVWDNTIKPSELSIYGWDANPWVWVIEFERCEKPK